MNIEFFQPDSKTGQMRSEEELARRQRILPIINEISGDEGHVEVAGARIAWSTLLV